MVGVGYTGKPGPSLIYNIVLLNNVWSELPFFSSVFVFVTQKVTYMIHGPAFYDIIAYLPNKVQISAVTVAALWKDLKKYDVL